MSETSETLLMPKATAVWLVDNTSLTFDQIAEFCGIHPLEVRAIADGESAQGMRGHDPILSGQLSREELDEAQADPERKLQLLPPKMDIPIPKRKGPRYTPLSKRQDRPNAIRWLVRNHPELKDAQIIRLVGTTKATISAIREGTHWNAAQLTPVDPVALGLCTQIDLDAEVEKASRNLGDSPPAETLAPGTLAPVGLDEDGNPLAPGVGEAGRSESSGEGDSSFDPASVFSKFSGAEGEAKDSDDSEDSKEPKE